MFTCKNRRRYSRERAPRRLGGKFNSKFNRVLSEECSRCPHRQRMPLSRRRPCRSSTPRNLAPTVGFVNIGLCNRRHLRCWAGVPTRQSLFQTSVDLFFFHFRVFHFSFGLPSFLPPVLEEGQEQRYRAALASLPRFREGSDDSRSLQALDMLLFRHAKWRTGRQGCSWGEREWA